MNILLDYDNEPVSQYPLGNSRLPVRRVVLRGRWGGRRAKDAPEPAVAPAIEVPVLVVPPVQNDEERGMGDSTNARLHRILHAK